MPVRSRPARPLRRTLQPDQGRGLVRWSATSIGLAMARIDLWNFDKAPSMERPSPAAGGVGYTPAVIAGRRASPNKAARPVDGRDPAATANFMFVAVRRCGRRRTTRSPLPLHRAQQPRLSSGYMYLAGDGRPPWPRHHRQPISATTIKESLRRLTRRSPRGFWRLLWRRPRSTIPNDPRPGG